MVGGGPGSMIGEAHREGVTAAGGAVLVAAAFSQSFEKTQSLGKTLGLAADRLYPSYVELIAAEKASPEKPDFVIICTPNSTHYPISKAFLEAGIAVACDKPLCFTVAEAKELQSIAKSANLPFCVTFTYTGYPSVRKVRQLVRDGVIGDLRFVNAEYPQGWLATPEENTGNPWAVWRLDPTRSGPVNTTGDIGVHVYSIVKTMTNLEISGLYAQLNTIVPGRKLDDTMSVIVDYTNGIHGLYWACQAIAGFNNDLKVRIAGSKGTIEWRNEKPDEFTLFLIGKEPELVKVPFDVKVTTPDHKAFVNIYKAFIGLLSKRLAGAQPTEEDLDFPTVDLGVEGVVYTTKCLESSQKRQWVPFE
jgi:predicted dehydrogenase